MIDGINFRAEAKRFTRKTLQANNNMLFFASVNSAIYDIFLNELTLLSWP